MKVTRGRSDCELLRPVLVALVYEEPHPEMGRLLEHLSSCRRCSEEVEDLAETREWIDCVADGLPAGEGGRTGRVAREECRGGLARWARGLHSLSWNIALSAAAVLLVAVLCFAGTASRSPSLSGDAVASTSMSARLSFTAEELDRGIEALRLELRSLRRLDRDSW